MAIPDRLALLHAQSVLTGIDFVQVDPQQTTLDVYFLREPSALLPALTAPGALTAAQLRIHADAQPDVPITGLAWTMVGGRDVLRLTTLHPGGFARYRLAISHPQVDPFFDDVEFSFKANCPSDLDCAPRVPECPPEPADDFPVDYQARDFWSFRRALLEFAALRYPDWQDRLEADVGVMLAEVMAALGDELAYYQDRVSVEAWLETATQRRSVRGLANLVDYALHDGLGATTWIDVTVAPGPAGTIAAGTRVVARSGVDRERDVVFEIGRGLAESGPPVKVQYPVDPGRNSVSPHLWDESQRGTCLPRGSTSLWIEGHRKADLAPVGRRVLLRTDPPTADIPARRCLVELTAMVEDTDPLLGTPITRLDWSEAQATPWELDLETLVVRGNLVPATAGRTVTHETPAGTLDYTLFSTGPVASIDEQTVERSGPDGALAHLYSLEGSDGDLVVRLGPDPRHARPEVRLVRMEPGLAGLVEREEWLWQPSFLRTVEGESSGPRDPHFVLDDGMWRRVAGYPVPGGELVHRDYATGQGVTIRFGDGEFGQIPPDGMIFKAQWRLGSGTIANVAADTLTVMEVAPAFVAAVTNPLAVTGAVDPEPEDDARRLAPQAFRADPLRAVRPEDYARAAERLPWVQRAGAAFRWTGSWLSCFVTADPKGASTLSDDRRVELESQLERFRQTGREVYVREPRYVDLDLRIAICVEPHTYRGHVEAAVRAALVGKRPPWKAPGFFDPDHFTFGTPLRRAALETAIQAVPGIRAVEKIQIRRRGWFDWKPFAELEYDVADDEVIRLDDDPLHPERGSLDLDLEGGA
jgi:hypothetical protein